MKKDRLKKLAREKEFIPGIYNYCDRWCERCPQTSHCLNFAMSEEEFADPEARDSDGSAKIALIGMDRSIGAWGVVRAHAPR